MADLFDAHSYEFQWLSLPYVLALLGLLGLGGYALVMSGAQLLRAAFLIICVGLTPVTASYALAGSMIDPAMAVTLYKLGLALVPTAAAGVLAFESLLTQKAERYSWLILLALGTSLAQTVPFLVTDWYIAGIWRTSWGLYHFEAGPLTPAYLGTVVLWGGLGGYFVYTRLQSETSPLRRRQLRGSMLGFAVFALSMIDVLLAYRVGVYPMSWLFFSIGTLLLFRSLAIDELVQTRVLDWRAALILLYLVVAGLGLGLVWSGASGASTVVLVLLAMGVYLVLRVGIALRQLMQHPGAGLADTPLERMIEQYAVRIQSYHEESEIADITSDTLALGLGCKRVTLIMPSPSDWSWETVDGDVLSEDATPDPLMFTWLLEHSEPVQRSELSLLHLGDFREPLERLLEANDADVLIPLVNHEDMVGLLLLGGLVVERPLSRAEVNFARKIQEHLISALVYARMRREASARVAMQMEVDLAAAIQSAFVSSAEMVDLGSLQVSGLWAPATQCGGDWWSVHEVPDGRVLVLIGDVTGHGVAAAMVTAAAKGCYDVAQRLMAEDIDLEALMEHLDATVRSVGAGQFQMTCFASLLDPARRTITFANAGHLAPYICRPMEGGGVDLGVLVARGNPLGDADMTRCVHQARDIAPGDVIVWYTDGLVESTDPSLIPFGERRMQRHLRKIDTVEPNARMIRDFIGRAVATFRNGHPADDDITLVVARVM